MCCHYMKSKENYSFYRTHSEFNMNVCPASLEILKSVCVRCTGVAVKTSSQLSYFFVFFLTQENTNIEEAARCLVEHILRNEESLVTEREPGSLILSGCATTSQQHLGCSSCSKW